MSSNHHPDFPESCNLLTAIAGVRNRIGRKNRNGRGPQSGDCCPRLDKTYEYQVIKQKKGMTQMARFTK
jgi:hypothetical protein